MIYTFTILMIQAGTIYQDEKRTRYIASLALIKKWLLLILDQIRECSVVCSESLVLTID